MRKLSLAFGLAFALGAGFGFHPTAAVAGEKLLGTGCSFTTSSTDAGSTSGDTDCVWRGGEWLTLQCTVGVYYTKHGEIPTSNFPNVATGDPYPILADSDSTVWPVRAIATSSSGTCNVFKADVE